MHLLKSKITIGFVDVKGQNSADERFVNVDSGGSTQVFSFEYGAHHLDVKFGFACDKADVVFEVF